MALPKQVQRQIEEAAQIEAQMNAPQPATESQPAPEPATPEAELPTAPAPAPEASPTPEPKQPVADPETETLRQRYASLQGKYEAEVPRLHQQNRELREQLDRLAQQMEALKRPPAEEVKPAVSDKDVEDFGADMLDMVRRLSTEVVTNVVNTQLRGLAEKLETRVAALEATVNGVAGRQQQTEEQRFYADLEAQVPNWKAIDAEPGWLAWLSEVDPLAGHKRQDLLNNAATAMDLKRVVSFFKAYEATKPTPAAAPAKAQSELARQVAPAKAAAAATPASTDKKFWNDAAVNAFYADVRRGKFVGREAEMQRIENDIHAAAAEGRYLKG